VLKVPLNTNQSYVCVKFVPSSTQPSAFLTRFVVNETTHCMCVVRFFVPKSVRLESLFFKELKKQDACEDERMEVSAEGCEEREKCSWTDAVPEQCSADDVQLMLSPSSDAASAAEDNHSGCDDDNTEFTSLQSRMFCHFFAIPIFQCQKKKHDHCFCWLFRVFFGLLWQQSVD